MTKQEEVPIAKNSTLTHPRAPPACLPTADWVSTHKQAKAVVEAEEVADGIWSQIVAFLQAVFRAADVDSSGELDRQEIRAAVHKVLNSTHPEFAQHGKSAIFDGVRCSALLGSSGRCAPCCCGHSTHESRSLYRMK